jgi:hypothetical protein
MEIRKAGSDEDTPAAPSQSGMRRVLPQLTHVCIYVCSKTYAVAQQVVLEGAPVLQPHTLLWVFVRQKQTKVGSCKERENSALYMQVQATI